MDSVVAGWPLNAFLFFFEDVLLCVSAICVSERLAGF